MAFPSVAAADTKTGQATSNSTTLTLTYPTNLQNGDLILAFIGRDGTLNQGTWPSGWVVTGTNANASAACLICAKKKSDGTETGNFNVTGLSNEQGPWRVIRIPAAQWEGTLGTTFLNSNASDGSVVRGAANSGTVAEGPNVTSWDPFNWAAEDTLWIAVSANDSTPTYTGFPTNYTQEDHTTAGGHSQSSGGAGGAGLGIAYRQLNASSEDPGAFTLSAGEDWGCFGIAVRPATAGAPDATINDTAAGAEARILEGQRTQTDTAAGAETTPLAGTSPAQADTATVGETITLQQAVSESDTASSVDSSALVGNEAQADSGGITEDRLVQGTPAAQADTATVNETNSGQPAIITNDTAATTEGGLFAAGEIQAETATAAETQPLSGAGTQADTATGAETQTGLTDIIGSDTGNVADTPAGQGQRLNTDSSTVTDTQLIQGQRTSADVATGADTPTTQNNLAQSDAATVNEAQVYAGATTQADSTTATDTPSATDPGGSSEEHTFSDTATVTENRLFDYVSPNGDTAAGQEASQHTGGRIQADVSTTNEAQTFVISYSQGEISSVIENFFGIGAIIRAETALATEGIDTGGTPGTCEARDFKGARVNVRDYSVLTIRDYHGATVKVRDTDA